MPFNLAIFGIVIVILNANLVLAGPPGLTARRVTRDDGQDSRFVFQFFKESKLFKEVQCFSGGRDYLGGDPDCSLTQLKAGGFLLSDCFGHDAICVDCRLVKLRDDGTLDPQFRTGFPTDFKALMERSKEKIKRIKKVTELPNGQILVEGNFISQHIPAKFIPKYDPNEPGDEHGAQGVLELDPTGKFLNFRPASH